MAVAKPTITNVLKFYLGEKFRFARYIASS
jgi:hypothetical protein